MTPGRHSGQAEPHGTPPRRPFRQLYVAAALIIGVCATGVDGLARKTQIPCEATKSSDGLAVVQSGSSSPPAGLVNDGPESFVFVEFTFSAELPPGAALEVWPQVEGEVQPWDLPPEQLSFDPVLWVMDERTGALARFDVTPIARAWARGELPNAGLVVRLANADEVATSLAPTTLSLEAPTLHYHDTTPTIKSSGETLDPGSESPIESPEKE